MSLFSRAAAQETLRPAERALLTFLNTFLVALIAVAYPIVVNALDDLGHSNTVSIDWRTVLQSTIQILAISLAMAIRKFFTSQSDRTLPGVSPTVYINPEPAPTQTTTAAASTEVLNVGANPNPNL